MDRPLSRFMLRIKSSSFRAFTIIELIVVIAIVIILAAISLPVLVRAKQSANRTKCITNLSQLGMAMHIYASDNDDGLVQCDQRAGRGCHWPDTLASYGVNQDLLRCPNDGMFEFDTGKVNYSQNFYQQFGQSYSYNFIGGAAVYPTLTSSPSPAKTMLFTEYQPFHYHHDFVYGKVNMVFYDGHTRPIPFTDRLNFSWPNVR